MPSSGSGSCVAGFGEFWGIRARNWYRVDYDDGDSEEYNLREV